jgi:hypothetical protein
MRDLVIELQGAHFKRAYYLYVLKVCHAQKVYFYIGQTGDNHYITARPPFRRLSGHLEDSGQSTQNQVYKYIASEILGYEEAKSKVQFSGELKQAVENFLVDSTIQMYIYTVCPFNSNVSSTVHHETVRKVCLLEKHVIWAFNDSGKRLMNKNIKKPVGTSQYPELFSQITSEFGL